MDIRHRKNKASKFPKNALALAIAMICCLLASIFFFQDWDSITVTTGASFPTVQPGNKKKNGLHISVFLPVYTDSNGAVTTSTVTEKLIEDLQSSASIGEVVYLDVEHPPAFLESCGSDGTAVFAAEDGASSTVAAQERFSVLKASKQPHLAMELLKYCALDHYKGGLYLDSQSTLSSTLDHVLTKMTKNSGGNVAILNDPKISTDSIHGALLYFNKSKQKQSRAVVKGMINVLLSTDVKTLQSSPLLLPKHLYHLISKDMGVAKLSSKADAKWYLLQHSCNLFALGERELTVPISNYALNSHRITQNCPEPNGFCCSIFDPLTYTPTMMTKHLLLPYQVLPPASALPKPLNHVNGHFKEEDLPYIATISERVHQKPKDQTPLTPNFFEILLQNDCLPVDKKCHKCLNLKKGSDCKTCASACPCYCKALCDIPVEEKFVSKSLVITPPIYARDPSRLVPRIVHQTYFEPVTQDKYPNMSRLIESFKQSGWQYKFYTDEMSLNFLSTHFPPEVREAYETLRPGAFKADLFRYCVLLIHGGVYADMDIMLEANLDLAVGPDIGFMVPQDEPGKPVNHRMCLWNGFLASAPGHPFLAKTIETVVNNVRNRFTVVDIDNMFCPNPELSVLHAFDTLFTAGPCILGAMVNKVLGRHGQTSFEAGEIDLWERSKQAALEKGTEFVIGVDDKPNKRIPGRAIILSQNKFDMGSHRFTFVEKNLVVAATDLPDSDDRANQEKTPEHYSTIHVKAGIYGLDRLYTDFVRANEDLRFYVDGQWSQHVIRESKSFTSAIKTTIQ
mmetsp:Transcript_22313/g.53066  ORF Transcript_22313/g.53066 Transcript_22313/m.53066 type:complete len:793 (+) Transcript_22313:312-2690(+)|eukprot:CAMPEP_0197175496 /NCGR_PEP_ID=MMETSP1423-20130617/1699_1 /TAXON_ID=476441 /ORGANISM="Pseudo-nitzschia heimii, Strain UNC1101" /LENGTH=792 /DNA_ID=CAMNT_0042624671 /DNA_START=234 /DNA_END=2612 /DNA_ORIENTATION=+